MKKVLLIIIFLFHASAHAGILLEFGGAYLSDSMKTPTVSTSSGYLWNLGVLFDYNKEVWGGWNFSGIATSATGTTTETFSTFDTGPYVKWNFGKNKVFTLGGAYNISSKGVYNDGTNTENWTGSSIWLQFGVNPEIKDDLRVGASLNYYMATYSKKVVSNTESTAANSKTWIFPMFSITKTW